MKTRKSEALKPFLKIRSVNTGLIHSVKTKENLQKLIFPEGITYDVENEAFRTQKVNGLFALNTILNSLSEDDINKQGGIKATLSHLVGKTGHLSNLAMNDLEEIKYFLEQNRSLLDIIEEAF